MIHASIRLFAKHKSRLNYACQGPFTQAIFSFDFLLLIDMNEWINNERAECVLPHLNIRYSFTRSHPSKGDRACVIRRGVIIGQKNNFSLWTVSYRHEEKADITKF